MAKITTTFGAFVGFLNPNKQGKLLLVRRTSPDSILPGVSFKGNWELPGGALEEGMVVTNYHIHIAFHKANEKVGIDIEPVFQPLLGPMYLTFFQGPQGNDVGGVIPWITDKEPQKGETMWVSPQELKTLADEFISETDAKARSLTEAKGLVSGWKKRMCCMALAALSQSPNPAYADEAKRMLI